MQLGEMATLTQTLTDETIEVARRGVRPQGRDRHRRRGGRRGARPSRTPTRTSPSARPWSRSWATSTTARPRCSTRSARPRSPPARPAASPSTSAPTRSTRTRRRSRFLDTPGHAGVHGDARPRRERHRHRRDRRRRRRRRDAADRSRRSTTRKAADVPILVAVNKIDQPGANPDKVKGELASEGLNPEDWGGETIFVDVSAKTKEGLDDLLEMHPAASPRSRSCEANPDAPASGTVIESASRPGPRPGRRPCSSSAARCSVGDARRRRPAAGAGSARCTTTPAPGWTRPEPGDPVEVLGFDGVCEAGEHVRVVENDRRARQLAAGARAAAEDRGSWRAARPARSPSRTSSRRPARARSRSSTSCSRPTSPARWRRCRTRSPSCRRSRSRST